MTCLFKKKFIYINLFLFFITYLFLPIQELFAQEIDNSEIDYELVERFSKESSIADVVQFDPDLDQTELNSDNYGKEDSIDEHENTHTEQNTSGNKNEEKILIEDSSKENSESVPGQKFSLLDGDIHHVYVNGILRKKFTSNVDIEQFRLVLPEGAKLENTQDYERIELLMENDDKAKVFALTALNKQKEFTLTFSFEISGKQQITIEDIQGEQDAAFLFIMVNEGARSNVSDEFLRSSASVSTVATFRNAWNNTAVTQIIVTGAATLTPAQVGNLNIRTSNVILSTSSMSSTGAYIQPRDSGSVLPISPFVTITLWGQEMDFWGQGIQISASSSYVSPIRGFDITSGNLVIRNGAVYGMSTNISNTFIVTPTTLTLQDGGGIDVSNGTVSPTTLNLKSGYFAGSSLSTTGTFMVAQINAGTFVPTTVNIDSKQTFLLRSSNSRYWTELNATIVNNSVTSTNQASFNTESVGNLSNYLYIADFVATSSGGTPELVPPEEEFLLTLRASPNSGGNPTAASTSLTQGSITTVSANPNNGYRFVRWEIISGTGSTLEDETSLETTFTMGNADTTVQAVYEEESIEEDTLTLEASPKEGGNPEYVGQTIDVGTFASIQANPNNGFTFLRWEIVSDNGAYLLVGNTSENAVLVLGKGETIVRAIYEEELRELNPVDPLDPEVEVDPENKPELPEEQGLFSIDFISSFNFGSQIISAQDQTYYAQSQRLQNSDGTLNESEERPNYVQISDRRSATDRGNGWQLAVTQNRQFTGENNQELSGAQLQFANQQFASIQNSGLPTLQEEETVILTPGSKQVLISAQGDSGMGTWIYRFGDRETASESVALMVPQGANPEATTYTTTLIWELSSVPGN